MVKINASRFGYSSADLEHRVKTGDRTAILPAVLLYACLCTPTHPCPNGSGGHLSTPSFTGTAEKPDHGTRYSVGRAPERNSFACGGIYMDAAENVWRLVAKAKADGVPVDDDLFAKVAAFGIADSGLAQSN